MPARHFLLRHQKEAKVLVAKMGLLFQVGLDSYLRRFGGVQTSGPGRSYLIGGWFHCRQSLIFSRDRNWNKVSDQIMRQTSNWRAIINNKCRLIAWKYGPLMYLEALVWRQLLFGSLNHISRKVRGKSIDLQCESSSVTNVRDRSVDNKHAGRL